LSNNAANAFAQVRESIAAVAGGDNTGASVGATAWNYFDDGVAPTFSGTLLRYHGVTEAGADYGSAVAGRGDLIFQNTTGGIIGTNNPEEISISLGGAISTTFAPSGNVGIGTTTPEAKLALDNMAVGTAVNDTYSATRLAFSLGGNAISLYTKATRHTAGTNWDGAEIRIFHQVDATPMGYISFNPSNSSQAVAIGTTSGEKMRIADNGNVGIGTTAPAGKLDVNGSLLVVSGSSAGVTIPGTVGPLGIGASIRGYYPAAGGGAGFEIGSEETGVNGAWISLGASARGDASRSSTIFTNANAERMRILANGNVGIGTPAPAAKLHVNGNSIFGSATSTIDPVTDRITGLVISEEGILSTRSNNAWSIGLPTTSGRILNLYTDNGAVVHAGAIDVSGGTTSYLTTSDRRLKTNIRDFKTSGKLIDRLHPKIYDWKDGGKDAVGFIAQELYEVFPAAVAKGDDNAKKVEQPWMVDYSKLIPVLVAEIQSLRSRVAELENKKP